MKKRNLAILAASIVALQGNAFATPLVQQADQEIKQQMRTNLLQLKDSMTRLPVNVQVASHLTAQALPLQAAIIQGESKSSVSELAE